MQIKLIEYRSAAYHQMIDLRMEMLRRPLGLSFTKEQLETEKDDFFLGAYENDILIGCSVLTPIDKTTIQLRQMAVKEKMQAKGTGSTLLEFAEKLAKEKGYKILMMHARKTALGFYRKNGYEIKGGEFIEATIAHYYMEKRLP
jgi:N-acetylglutamate synthase-like GNAT family acetyltransferase